MAFFALLHECVFSWREHTRRDDGIGTTPLQRALTYDQAFRDMFFVGDVTADLGRIICEAPTVCWRGGKRVRQAQREREARRQQQMRHKMELPPHEEEKQAARRSPVARPRCRWMTSRTCRSIGPTTRIGAGARERRVPSLV